MIVTDIYTAGEENPAGVTGELIAEALQRFDPTLDTLYSGDLSVVSELLEHLSDDSDAILVLGAGDVGSIIDTLLGGVGVSAIDELVGAGRGPRARARTTRSAYDVPRRRQRATLRERCHRIGS